MPAPPGADANLFYVFLRWNTSDKNYQNAVPRETPNTIPELKNGTELNNSGEPNFGGVVECFVSVQFVI